MSIPFALDITFKSTNLSNAIFIGLNLSNVTMSDCIAKGAVFEEVDLSNANLSGSDFEEAIFKNTILTKASFVNAKNYTIDHSYNNIKEAKFSLPEASRLLNGLGIVIE